MAIEIDSNWPLMVVTSPRESTLQKKSSAHLPSLNPKDSVIPGNGIELESDTSWEKGMFIDLYA